MHLNVMSICYKIRITDRNYSSYEVVNASTLEHVELEVDIINNKLPFVVIKQKCTDQFTNPEKYNGNESNTEELREKLKI